MKGISDRSADLAAACLDAAPQAVGRLQHEEIVAFIDFAASISDSAWPEASLYFQRGPELLRGVEPAQRASYLELSTRVARRIGRQSYALFAEGTAAMREVDAERHKRFIELGERLVAASPVAAMSFLKSAPALAERLRPGELEAWHEAGLEILQGSVEGGEAYFRLESGRAEQMIQSVVRPRRFTTRQRAPAPLRQGADRRQHQRPAPLRPRIEGHRLGPGARPLHGGHRRLTCRSTSSCSRTRRKTSPSSRSTPRTRRPTSSLAASSSASGAPAKVLPRRRHQRERERRAEGLVEKKRWLTDMERYFDLFGERQMASDLFALVEDLRIDRRVRLEYSGIRRSSKQVQERELQQRPEVRILPLRQAFIENLIRASLDGESTMEWPKPLEPILAEWRAHAAQAARRRAATVEDAAEAR